MIARSTSRPGFSLLEAIILMCVLSTAMTTSTLILVAAINAEKLAGATHDQIARQTTMAGQFRDDVHRAIGVREKWNAYTAGPHCLILEFPAGKHVVYSFSDAGLLRDTNDARQLLPMPQKGCTVEFTVKESLIVLRIADITPKDNRPPYEIIAARGGAKL